MKKLLLDENISQRVIARISMMYSGSAHVKDFGLEQTDDDIIWNFAKTNDYIIVSKDSDFHQKSLLWGPPPKFICEWAIAQHLILFEYFSIIIPRLPLLLRMKMKVFWC
jgi:predicted nuclease of predicted toxin-antitoxin system